MLQFTKYKLSLREERITIKLKLRHILTVLGVIALIAGGYVGWQLYQGQQMANQYAADAQKSAQGSGKIGNSVASPSPGSKGTGTGTAPAQTSPNSTSVSPQSSATEPNASTPNSSTPAPNTPAALAYKQLMTSSYQQTLQAMQNVKSSTLALQGHKVSLSAYKADIVQAQATFSAAQAFVQANPPPEETLNSSYQEFLAGINLAKQAMDVVLNGVSSFSPASLYAAREMGKQALKQVSEGYAHF